MTDISTQSHLQQAYQQAEYVIFSRTNVRFSINQHSCELENLMQSHQAQYAAFLTACNPRSQILTDEENDKRTNSLQDVVKARGYTFYEGEALDLKGEWPAEPSVFILHITLDEAAEVARHYQQNAFVQIEKRIPQLIWVNEFAGG